MARRPRQGVARRDRGGLRGGGLQGHHLGPPLPGEHKNNICNRGINRAGVQLELPKSLRAALVENAERRALFAGAIRRAISEHLREPGAA
ncbi:poly-gamma-glutamate hydrolase family protein [Mesorhizobium argentiipisi]|uniref:poly-gamma-glutamate hydrolase family protein n=1 Tax=Mesorhizobium argentiipisi TaxID=3015175 RepID=UPI0039F5FA02